MVTLICCPRCTVVILRAESVERASRNSLALSIRRLPCRVSRGSEPLDFTTADHFTALFETAVKFDQHFCRVFVLLDCSPIGGEICDSRYRRFDANDRHDIFDKEESGHERAIRQGNASATGETILADEFVERLEVPHHLDDELLAD